MLNAECLSSDLNPNVAKAGGEKRWPEIGPILKFTMGLFLAKRFNAV
jgi:hypothetical protein